MTTLTTLAARTGALRAALAAHTRQIANLAKQNTNQATNIAALATNLAALADAVTAHTAAIAAVNAKTQRVVTTVGPLAIGNTDVTITWGAPWPDTGYGVWIELISGGAALGTLHKTLKVGSKTVNDCIVTINATQAVASVGVDVLGVRT